MVGHKHRGGCVRHDTYDIKSNIHGAHIVWCYSANVRLVVTTVEIVTFVMLRVVRVQASNLTQTM